MQIVVPGIPPSVNMYVRHSRGRHYVTKEAERFQSDIAVLASGYKVDAPAYQIEIHVLLGKGQRGDVDNFAKVVLDGLVKAGVIHSDSAVQRLHISKERGKEAKTMIEIYPLGVKF